MELLKSTLRNRMGNKLLFKVFVLLVSIFFSLIIASCAGGAGGGGSGADADETSLAITVPDFSSTSKTLYNASDITSITATISSNSYNSTKSANRGETMKFTNIPAGDYSVVAYGKTSDGKVAAKGSASVVIKSGQTTTTTIHLARIEHFTVSFKDGATLISSQEVSQGYTVSKPADPTKEGHTFSNWKKDGISYDFNTPITGDTELVANWDTLTYTVTFNYNGGTAGGLSSSGPITYDYGETPSPTAPTKTATDGSNYVFLGWAISSSATTGSLSVPSVTGNATYYAVWKPKYTVTFNYNGGKDSSDHTSSSVLVNSGSAPMAPSPSALTRTGYTFVGWAASSTATSALASLPAVTENKTFYAVWDAVTYTITYTIPSGLSITVPDSFKSYTVAAAKTLPAATDLTYSFPTGLSFAGWYEDSDYSGSAKTSISAGTTGNKTYYAKVNVSIVLNKDNGTANTTSTVAYGKKLSEPTDPTKTGYKFLGWFKDTATTVYNFNTTVSESFTLKAHWGTYTDFDGTATEFADAIFEDTSSATSPYNVNITDVTSLEAIGTAIGTKQIYVNLTLTMAASNTNTTFFMGWGTYKSYLVGVVIPDGFTTINYQCFNTCSNLTSATIPDSVTRIEGQAFSGTNLTSLLVTGTWTWFSGGSGSLPIDGEVLTKDNIAEYTTSSGSLLTRE